MSLLYPDRCLYCGKIITDHKISICKDCIIQLPIIKGERCARCGAAITDCKCKRFKLYIDRNISLLRYEGVGKTIIKRMKFNSLPQLTEFMGSELAILIKNHYNLDNIDAITYVPMHFIKRIKRGYNQAELLAQRVGEILDIPVVPTLKRKFSIDSQKDRKLKERFQKMRNAISCHKKFNYKNILIIDDVYTTGATINACALCLKQNGAQTVYSATFALTCKK